MRSPAEQRWLDRDGAQWDAFTRPFTGGWDDMREGPKANMEPVKPAPSPLPDDERRTSND